MQFSEIIALPSHKNISTWLHGVPAKFADRKIVKIFLRFSEDAALPAQDMLHVHTEILMCDGNIIISCNCIAITSKKLHV